ncbi:MAG: hypothetical protein AAGA75_24355 [Cyanobacteria bacterium P01_E01_bin.6]
MLVSLMNLKADAECFPNIHIQVGCQNIMGGDDYVKRFGWAGCTDSLK